MFSWPKAHKPPYLYDERQQLPDTFHKTHKGGEKISKFPYEGTHKVGSGRKKDKIPHEELREHTIKKLYEIYMKIKGPQAKKLFKSSNILIGVSSEIGNMSPMNYK